MSDHLTLEAAVGQLICPTLFHGKSQQPYDAAQAAELLDRYGWGGYVLFCGGREETAARIAALQARATRPLLIAADLEHGAGCHVEGLSVFPPPMAFGAAGRPDYAYALGAWTAREARSVGVNWIFGPVMDVTNNPLNPIISIRAFGGRADRVGAMGEAFIRGCQDQGALACAKHFPGHGDTETDSHSRLGLVNVSRERLETVEFPPFKAAIAAGVASLMSAHLALPALDDPNVPATLSRAVMTELLRDQWGYDGLVVTDAMVMGGITGAFAPGEAAVRAIAAGCDMILMPRDPVETFEALLAAVRDGQLSEARIREAAERVQAAKRKVHAPPAADPPITPAALRAQVARDAITLAKGPQDLKLDPETLVITVDDGIEAARLIAWDQALAARGFERRRLVDVETGEAAWREIRAEASQSKQVLLGVFSPIRIHKDRSVLPAALLTPLQALTETAKTVVVSFSSPFLVSQFPAAEAWVLTFGARPCQLAAAAAALTEGKGFSGHMPVELPAALDAAPQGAADAGDRRASFAT